MSEDRIVVQTAIDPFRNQPHEPSATAGLEQLVLRLEQLTLLLERGATSAEGVRVGARGGPRDGRGDGAEGGLRHREPDAGLRAEVSGRVHNATNATDLAIGLVRGADLGRGTGHEVEVTVGLGAVVHAVAVLDGLRAGCDQRVLGPGTGRGREITPSLFVALGLGGQTLRLGSFDLADELARLHGGQVLRGDLDAAIRGDHQAHAVLRCGDLGGIGRLVRHRSGDDRDVDDGSHRRLGLGRGDENGGEEERGDESDHVRPRVSRSFRIRRVEQNRETRILKASSAREYWGIPRTPSHFMTLYYSRKIGKSKEDNPYFLYFSAFFCYSSWSGKPGETPSFPYLSKLALTVQNPPCLENLNHVHQDPSQRLRRSHPWRHRRPRVRRRPRPRARGDHHHEPPGQQRPCRRDVRMAPLQLPR